MLKNALEKAARLGKTSTHETELTPVQKEKLAALRRDG